MASSKEYLEFILGQLSELEDITYRTMMGEFIIYYRGKVVGGIYDDRLLVKPVNSAIGFMPTATYEVPYEGSKEMLLVDEVDNKEFLAGLVYGEKYGYHTHYLPLQDAVDYLFEQFELMKTASLTVDRDMTICQCEYRKEGEQE